MTYIHKKEIKPSNIYTQPNAESIIKKVLKNYNMEIIDFRPYERGELILDILYQGSKIPYDNPDFVGTIYEGYPVTATVPHNGSLNATRFILRKKQKPKVRFWWE